MNIRIVYSELCDRYDHKFAVTVLALITKLPTYVIEDMIR